MEYDSANVKCPYYLGNNTKYQCQKVQIRCEGVSKGNSISLEFVSDQVRQTYKENFCYSLLNCNKCLIHKMLNRKYGVNDET